MGTDNPGVCEICGQPEKAFEPGLVYLRRCGRFWMCEECIVGLSDPS